MTWADGSTGITGTISDDNSLVGNNMKDSPPGSQGDQLGNGGVFASADGDYGGVTALANGNYVVDSSIWNNREGAVTWGNGLTGTVGTVSDSNSLVGTRPNNFTTYTGDSVGRGDVTALANGNYVVDSYTWNNLVGAVTWGNGTTGTVGTVSAANSLVGSDGFTGSYAGDEVGAHTDEPGNPYFGITALSNGNYVVDSADWNGMEGAVTWGNGMTGVTGVVSTANSLTGSREGDELGGGAVNSGITALSNGNYVVLSPLANMATWGNGTTGTDGTISTDNSLPVQGANAFVAAFPNGNYVVIISGDGGVGSVTWTDGTTGATLDGQNTIEAQNSLLVGTSLDPVNSGNLFFVGGTACFTDPDPNLLTYALSGLGQGQTLTVTPDFLARTLDAGTNVTIQANDDITINSPITETPSGTAGNLSLQAGRSILINANITTAGGDLSLIGNDTVADGVVDGQRDAGNASITEQSGATIDTGTGTLDVDLKTTTDKTHNDRGVVTLLGVTGSLTLSNSTTVGISINGTVPGDGVAAGSYTQANLAGSINLNGALLAVTHLVATSPGTSFTIIQTTAGVTGQFSGLAEGATVVAQDGSTYTISYQGNGGKNVVLTQVGVAAQPGQLAFDAATYTATEGGANATITVTRTNGSDGSVTVAYATGGGTAVAGQDYTGVSGTLTFADGVTSQTFTIPILNNGQSGGSETVNLTLRTQQAEPRWATPPVQYSQSRMRPHKPDS